jgi:hypothetical protein
MRWRASRAARAWCVLVFDALLLLLLLEGLAGVMCVCGMVATTCVGDTVFTGVGGNVEVLLVRLVGFGGGEIAALVVRL